NSAEKFLILQRPGPMAAYGKIVNDGSSRDFGDTLMLFAHEFQDTSKWNIVLRQTLIEAGAMAHRNVCRMVPYRTAEGRNTFRLTCGAGRQYPRASSIRFKRFHVRGFGC